MEAAAVSKSTAFFEALNKRSETLSEDAILGIIQQREAYFNKLLVRLLRVTLNLKEDQTKHFRALLLDQYLTCHGSPLRVLYKNLLTFATIKDLLYRH